MLKEKEAGQRYRFPFGYRGNILWLILFLIIFPPLGLLLFILNGTFRTNSGIFGLHYNGSQFWLLFWTILFFPIAMILAIVKGFDAVELIESDP